MDFYNQEITNDKLDEIYSNIDWFYDEVKKYKNILFICSDYPGYGGAATNCHNIQLFFKNKGHQTYGLYYYDDYDFNKNNETKELYKVVKLNSLSYFIKNLHFKPELVIFKNFINFDIKTILNIPIFYLVAGIYKNNLDKFYYELKTKEENDKFINPFVLKQIKMSDRIFCNSLHTSKILKDIYNINTELFYSSFVPFYKEKIDDFPNWDNRYYDYAFISSNFDRKIKNINESIEFLKKKHNEGKKILLIGEKSSKYNDFGFEYLELVPKERMKSLYLNIKYIYQNSFYESCSNVKIEGSYFGCKIIP